MTFEKWYKQTYPDDYNLVILARSPNTLAKSPLAIERYEQAKAAWEASRDNLRSWDI